MKRPNTLSKMHILPFCRPMRSNWARYRQNLPLQQRQRGASGAVAAQRKGSCGSTPESAAAWPAEYLSAESKESQVDKLCYAASIMKQAQVAPCQENWRHATIAANLSDIRETGSDRHFARLVIVVHA